MGVYRIVRTTQDSSGGRVLKKVGGAKYIESQVCYEDKHVCCITVYSVYVCMLYSYKAIHVYKNRVSYV